MEKASIQLNYSTQQTKNLQQLAQTPAHKDSTQSNRSVHYDELHYSTNQELQYLLIIGENSKEVTQISFSGYILFQGTRRVTFYFSWHHRAGQNSPGINFCAPLNSKYYAGLQKCNIHRKYISFYKFYPRIWKNENTTNARRLHPCLSISVSPNRLCYSPITRNVCTGKYQNEAHVQI
jgi:hypothetical protein